MEFAGKKVLILLDDGSYLYDNRVKREAATLTEAGYQVSVICPRYSGESYKDIYNGVFVYRYNKWHFGGHLGEYISSLIKGGWLTLRTWIKHGGFDCVQACNPPDFLFLLAAPFKFVFNSKFIFDHHDISPELFISRFGGAQNSIGYQSMKLLEKLTFKMADGVLSTNESYKKIAINRGKVREKRIRVVRNGPILKDFPLMKPDPAIKKNGNVVVGYIGNMNPQDGVDHLLRAAKYIVHGLKRKEFYFVLIGKGDSFQKLKELKTQWGLDDYVHFTGRIPDDDMFRVLNSCDICVQPDPINPLNNLSTMNKAMEYMALEKPVVAYDLIETRVSCQDCALYAEADTLGDKIVELADNDQMRLDMGLKGRKRVKYHLEWKYSEKNLLDLYQAVLGDNQQLSA
jgi:glycosyltransferase involved in cell wall biosynthesis